jgi:hypothetical protein
VKGFVHSGSPLVEIRRKTPWNNCITTDCWIGLPAIKGYLMPGLEAWRLTRPVQPGWEEANGACLELTRRRNKWICIAILTLWQHMKSKIKIFG